MKHTLTLLALTAALASNAQCYDYDCSDATVVNIEDGLSNYEGSVCFSGIGTIPTSVNFNNWSVLSFDGEITVNQNVNFGLVGTKLISKGNNSFSFLSMDGSDTVYVKSGICQVETIISNNSFDGSRNVVVVDEGAEFYFNDVLINPWGNLDESSFGTVTVLTAGGTGNNIKVITGCNDEALPIGINLTGRMIYCDNVQLFYSAPDAKDFVVQQSTDGKNWKGSTPYNTGQMQKQILEPTYFRVKADGVYSNVYYAIPECKGVEVYPNPTTDFLTINGQINGYYVSDLSGRVLLSGNENKVSLQSLASGLYILTVNNQTFKIVKH